MRKKYSGLFMSLLLSCNGYVKISVSFGTRIRKTSEYVAVLPRFKAPLAAYVPVLVVFVVTSCVDRGLRYSVSPSKESYKVS